MKRIRWKLIFVLLVTTLAAFWSDQIYFSKAKVTRQDVVRILSPAIRHNQFPKFLSLEGSASDNQVLLNYTIDTSSQAYIQKLFEHYKPDYGALVAMDAETGEIISMVSYTKNDHLELGNLALRATFPAASVFKVVTATAAVDKFKLSPETIIQFQGRNHTLYKRNVLSARVNRWTRRVTLKEAFAKSINTVFAKIGINHLNPDVVEDYAGRFKFNEPITTDVPVQMGHATLETTDAWEMAEVASGFNRRSTMSPLQGALIAAAVVNDGKMMSPYVVDSMYSHTGELLYQSTPVVESDVMSAESAKKLRVLMRATVTSGTSRKMFRDLVRAPAFEEVEFGGKTGSLRGRDPVGKTDWYVGYAKDGDRKIAVGAITVHRKYWTVRSAYLARKFLEYQLRHPELRQARYKSNKNRI